MPAILFSHNTALTTMGMSYADLTRSALYPTFGEVVGVTSQQKYPIDSRSQGQPGMER